MILAGKFFTVKQEEKQDGSYVILFDHAHPIFSGHFPGQPVVPGVCMIQIIKELLEGRGNAKLQLQQADHLKFLAVINPLETPEVNVSMEINEDENPLVVSGKIYRNELVFLKFKMGFTIVQ